MPQLVKGGKWVFGWVVVGDHKSIQIPPHAYEEYGFCEGETVVFTKTSKTSGGFGIARKETFNNSILKTTRLLTTAVMEKGGRIRLDPQLNALPGDRFLAVRGSYLALSFLKQGPIINEAEKHRELEVFLP